LVIDFSLNEDPALRLKHRRSSDSFCGCWAVGGVSFFVAYPLSNRAAGVGAMTSLPNFWPQYVPGGIRALRSHASREGHLPTP
jgi:hypothetical protein